MVAVPPLISTHYLIARKTIRNFPPSNCSLCSLNQIARPPQSILCHYIFTPSFFLPPTPRAAFREPLLGPTSTQTQSNDACAASGSSCVYYKSRRTVPFVKVQASINSSMQIVAHDINDSEELLKWSASLNG